MNNPKVFPLFSFLLTFFIVGLKPGICKVQSPKTVITGKIMNYEKYARTRVVSLCLQGMGHGFGPSVEEAQVNADGSFRLELALDEKREFLLKPFFNVHIYANPGGVSVSWSII